MSSLKKMINSYARFVAHHPVIVILLAVMLSVVAIQQAQTIQTKSVDNKNMLPDNLEVMKAMDLLDDQFGGTSSMMFALELDPVDINSSIKDIRDPRVLDYMDKLGQLTMHTDDVVSVSSAATVLRSLNRGHMPNSLSEVETLYENNSEMLDSYISKDYTMALVKISLADGYDENELLTSMNDNLDFVPKPVDVKASLAGSIVAQPIVRQQLGSDSTRTSMFSMIGIIFVLLLLFRSIKYGFIPLATIGVGVIWAFGYIGLVGMSMSSVTSGVISMIMGIGIDFGIQTVTRFRQELKVASKKFRTEEAMIVTLNNVIVPMATTTLAALIGFKAMSMGQLTMMAEMGTMMSYGITACFLAAITIVPSLLILFEKINISNFWR